MDEILMKTLIFNGSARKDGDTQNLIDELTAQLKGEYKIVNHPGRVGRDFRLSGGVRQCRHRLAHLLL